MHCWTSFTSSEYWCKIQRQRQDCKLESPSISRAWKHLHTWCWVLPQLPKLHLNFTLEASPRKTYSSSDLCFLSVGDTKHRAGCSRALSAALLITGRTKEREAVQLIHDHLQLILRCVIGTTKTLHTFHALQGCMFHHLSHWWFAGFTLLSIRNSAEEQKYPLFSEYKISSVCVCTHFIHRLYFLSNDLWVSLVSWNWVLFACSQLPFLPLSSKESLLKWLLWTLSRSPEGWYRKQRVSFLYKLLGCSHNSLKFICPQQPAIGQKINGLSRDQAKHN